MGSAPSRARSTALFRTSDDRGSRHGTPRSAAAGGSSAEGPLYVHKSAGGLRATERRRPGFRAAAPRDDRRGPASDIPSFSGNGAPRRRVLRDLAERRSDRRRRPSPAAHQDAVSDSIADHRHCWGTPLAVPVGGKVTARNTTPISREARTTGIQPPRRRSGERSRRPSGDGAEMNGQPQTTGAAAKPRRAA
jgi:hypothetical protein